jgi:penicillin-binding protein 1A
MVQQRTEFAQPRRKEPMQPAPKRRRFALWAIAALVIIAAAGVSIGVYSAWLFHDLPDANELVDYYPPTATRVYAWDGQLIGEFSTERRIFVPYDQIPPRVVNAFLAAEDRNFFHHGGVDVTGVGRALTKDVVNVVQGKRPEGGSTITQQVAKNILLTNEVSLGRKLKEAIVASRMEQTLSKQRILELYLNEIWLGYRSYGVGVAAYNYFGKTLPELSIAQAAYLAALPKGPDNYHPIRHKKEAIARRNWIIDQMAELGEITRADADAAKAEDLVVNSAPQRAKYKDADYFVEEVRRRSLAQFGSKLMQGGYYVRTTLDPTLQSTARKALQDGLERYDRRHGWRGAFGNVPVSEGWQKAALAKPVPAERTNWRAAIVESVEGGTVRVALAEGGGGTLASEDVAWARAGKGLKSGDLIFVEPAEKGATYRLKQVPAVNGAMVVMEPQTGRVLAMVGGYSFSLSSFNRATQAYRQPGSSFKPYVYAAALENGFTPASVVLDGPISLVGADGKAWTPENYEHDFLGPLVLRRGIELSRNTMTVRIAQTVGMKKIIDVAKSLGVVDKMDPVLAMALGAGETTPLRQAAGYSAFINGGHSVTPHLIEVVQDRNGKVLMQGDQRKCAACDRAFNGEESPRLEPVGKQVLDPVTAYQITTFLQGVVQRGTGAAAASLGHHLGG